MMHNKETFLIVIYNIQNWEWSITGLTYRKVYNIRRTKSQNFNVSRLIMYLSLPDPLKPGVKSRMKMSLEQRR